MTSVSLLEGTNLLDPEIDFIYIYESYVQQNSHRIPFRMDGCVQKEKRLCSSSVRLVRISNYKIQLKNFFFMSDQRDSRHASIYNEAE